MIYISIMIIFAIATIYNLLKYQNIIVRAKFVITDYISIFITIFLIIFIVLKFVNNIIHSISLIIVLFVYIFSGILVKGYNKYGVFTTGKIFGLAKFIKWNKIENMGIEYNVDNAIDVLYSTKLRAFKHRYEDKFEKNLLNIKKELLKNKK